ncbi:MAG: efflux RND transporter permease subunit [Verrucomicrobiota bacterium]
MSDTNDSKTRGSKRRENLVTWFARNSVAANLLMVALLLGGAFAALNIRQEVFPGFQLDFVDITMSYPGASPEEIEDGIIIPIEEQLRGLDITERVVAEATEGRAKIEIELVGGADAGRAVQDVSNAVSQISFFPEDAEEPVIGLRSENDNIFWIVVHGPLDEAQIFQLSERIRRDLNALPEITQAKINQRRPPEIALEIPEAQLRSLGLSLDEVANIVRQNARDLPGGGVRTPGGDVLLRSSERRDNASNYGDIPLVTNTDGTKVRVQDVAEIRDGFEDRPFENFYNGGRGVFIWVDRNGDEKPLEIAAAISAYLERLRPTLPEGIKVEILRDRAEQYESRLNLLLRNGIIGLALILVVLGLFLEPRLALWVAVGIPTTIVGALILLPVFDASVNMITLFAFIITLGIVVDDAVIVGENVFHKIQSGVPRLKAAVEGTREMVVPVLFAVTTNIIAFLPLLFVPGETGRFFAPLPAVVIAVFVVSILEALFILPAHLGHGGKKGSSTRRLLSGLAKRQARFSDGFERLTERYFLPAVKWTLLHRYLTVSAVSAIVAIILAYAWSGRVNYSFNPVIAGLRVDSEVQTARGAPFSDTIRVAKQIEEAGIRAANRLGGIDEVIKGRMNVMGRRNENWIDMNFILVEPEDRDFDQAEFATLWREEIGELPGLESLYFEWEEGPSSGSGLTIELSHPDRRSLEKAATFLATKLAEYDGVTDVRDGFAAGKPQLDIELKPEGRALGLSSQQVARQIRSSFFGAEALRFQRGRYEVRVMVRLPENERRSLSNVENLIIRTSEGGEVPLAQVAELIPGRAFTEINRIDGRRIITVTNNVVADIANVNDIRAAVVTEVFPQLKANFPELEIGFGGRQREQARAMKRLQLGLAIAGFAVFALLASLFRSYIQAVLVLSIIPIAIAATIVGHIVLGHDLSVISLFGIIALSGLAINGGLVFTQEMNRRREAEGLSDFDAALTAAQRRFRPILLTSLTTFAGLSPMIFETDPQALFLVPMAIALGLGSLISGLVLLFTLPAAMMIWSDLT